MQLFGLVDVIPLVTDTIGECIDLPDLLQAHMALAHVGEAFSAHVWQSRASEKCQGFDISETLFEPNFRPQVLAFIPTLISTCLARGVTLPISTMDCFRQLRKHMDRAQRTAAAHSASGYRAQVLICCVRFPFEGLEEMLSNGGSDITRETSLRLALAEPIEVHEPAGIQEAGEGTALARWATLHLALSTGFLLARAVDLPARGTRPPCMAPTLVQEPAQDERRRTETMSAVTVDLTSLCHEVTIHLRGVALNVNGEIRRACSSGMFFFSRGNAAAAKALQRGVLCVLCLREGRIVPKTMLASSLNLDRVDR
eukprot:TRINITY_DN25184_c0_g1_i1.p1 TRINITY_DN25184_c0_g1~~TRINITY_DN25184_c0_g1_i1.p1  ORF type:complete len:312 (+),score=34.48 TRINITY_DN25184_c0_g1_i1:81-1016(+)